MNEERTLKLLNALTEVREEYIEDAARTLRRPVLRRLGTVAACLCLLIGGWYLLQALGIYIYNPFIRAGSGHPATGGQALAAYHYYAGPVLPLTAEEDGLTAERLVEYDFSLFDPARKETGEYTALLYRQSCLVTDSYLLRSRDGSGTVTLYYPFVASFTDTAALLPTVTAAGEEVETELLVGPGSPDLASWPDLTALMEEDWPERTPEVQSWLEKRVTVYALSAFHGQKGELAPNPTVALEFTLDRSRSKVFTFGFNGGSDDLQHGSGARIASVSENPNGRTAYLLVLGEDFPDWTLRGYADGACQTPMESAGATVNRYESTLGEMLTLLLRDYRVAYLADKQRSLVSTDTLLDLTCQAIRESPARLTGSPDWGLEDVFDRVLSQSRVLYLRFTAAVPAGEETRVEVRLVKYPSTDHGGPERTRQGFDLAGRLGSRIAFTRLEAAVSGGEYIQILRQDFGFDPEKGILRVSLDPEGEHWYMDVTAKGGKQG